MTTINPYALNTYTLADLAKDHYSNGVKAEIINSLGKRSSFMEDLQFLESNMDDGHEVSAMTSLPTAYRRRLNDGIPASKATNRQYKEGFEMLATRSIISRDMIDMAGGGQGGLEFILQKSLPHMEALGQKIASQFFYGSRVSEPESMIGLSYRYNSLNSTTTNPQYENVIDCGGVSNDNTSIWLVGHGKNKIHGIYPRGTKAGIVHNIQNHQQMVEGTNGEYLAYVNEWTVKHGLCVADWRYAVRLANIDVSDLRSIQGTQAIDATTSIRYKLFEAFSYFPDMSNVVIYCNRAVLATLPMIQHRANDFSFKLNDAVNQMGKVVPGYTTSQSFVLNGVPLRLEDTILNTESCVS